MVWVYVREHDQLQIEIQPTENGFNVVVSASDGTACIEHLLTPGWAIHRQEALENRLLAEGWHLRYFLPSPSISRRDLA